MNVLLIVSVPDPKRNPAWHATADVIAIREAVRGLAVAARSTGASIVVADHPAIVPLMASILPARQLHIIMRKAEPVLANVDRAFLVGGCDEELSMAWRVHLASIRVIPIASTGAAAAKMHADMSHNGEFTANEAIDLIQNHVYAPLFERYLSP